MQCQTANIEASQKAKLKFGQGRLRLAFSRQYPLYIMLIPALVLILLFRLLPLLGSSIAFVDYNIYTSHTMFSGILNSPWVGFKWFIQFFTYDQFRRLLANTITISLYQLIFAFPAPIILACLLNELKNYRLKRTIQTIVYLPHFLSWSIIFGISYMLLSTRIGLVNLFLMESGHEPVNFLNNVSLFKPLIITAGMWKEMGWGTIIFLAAIAGINLELYEAAIIDGAGRWKRFVYITLPGLIPAITTLLLIKIGFIMDAGFEQIYIFMTPLTQSVGDIIDTFAFVHGIQQAQYGISTAVGLFKSVVGLILMLIANKSSKLMTGEGLF